MKRILVAAGTSENKKKQAIEYIDRYLRGKNIEAEVVGANIYEMNLEQLKPDLIVAIGPVNFTTEIPLIPGTAFVIGIGTEAVCDKIIASL